MSGEIDKVFFDLKTKLRRFKQEFASEFIQRVERRTPVRTGAMKGGWGQTQKAEGFEVWNTQDYARYVNDGTPRTRPVRMLEVAAAESEQIAALAAQRAGLK